MSAALPCAEPGGYRAPMNVHQEKQQGEARALVSCSLLTKQLGKTQPVQSKKSDKYGTRPLWRGPSSLPSSSEKSTTGRRCTSHQNSLEMPQHHSHPGVPNSQKQQKCHSVTLGTSRHCSLFPNLAAWLFMQASRSEPSTTGRGRKSLQGKGFSLLKL